MTKAYGLHVLYVSLIMSEFIYMMFSIVLFLIRQTIALVLFTFSLSRLAVYVVGFAMSYYKRTTEYLNGTLEKNPELKKQIIDSL